jgi:hypothetical protein
VSKGEIEVSRTRCKQRAHKKRDVVSSDIGSDESEEIKNEAFGRYYHKLKEIDESGDCYVYRTAVREESHIVKHDDLYGKNIDVESSLPAPFIREKLLGIEYFAELDGSGTHCFFNEKIENKIVR